MGMPVTAAPLAALQALDGVDVSVADQLTCQAWLADARRVRGFLDSFDAKVLRRTRELAEVGESFGPDDTSTRCSGVSSKDAKDRTERSKTLEHAEGFDEALAAGDVTAGHVDELGKAAAGLSDELRGELFDHAADLLEHATSHDPARFGRHVRDLARNLERDAGISRERQQKAATFLSWKVSADGMYDVHARLHPLLGNRLVRALDAEVAARVAAGEAAGEPEFVERSVNRGRLAAETLVDLVSGRRAIDRPLVSDISVLVDAETLATGASHENTVAEDSHGAPLPIVSIRALLCMGVITPVMLDTSGTVLNLGRRQRLPNREQRRALRAIYRTCAAHGREVSFDRCEVHRIIEWHRHGPTDLANLIPICSRHHHLIHQHGWRLRLDTDRTLTVTDRNGATVMVATPDMPHPSRRPPRRTGPAPAGAPSPAHETRLAS